MQAAPQEGDSVKLVGGETGWISRVIAYWGNLRCWDVHVFDPKYQTDAPFVGEKPDVRGAQVREQKGDVKHVWREVTL